MKIPAKNPEITYDMDGNMRITFTTPYKLEDIAGELDELRDKDIDLTIERHRKKRSLDANAYCWTLIGKLAAKLRMPPEEVYRDAIRDIGGNYTIICVREQDAGKVAEWWRYKGIGWLADPMESKIGGCANLMLHVGSSKYDTMQMSLLIDRIAQDCKDQGIATRPQSEIEALAKSWGVE